MKTVVCWGVCVLACVSAAHAATLSVGPAGKFAKPSAAIAAAKDGDIIEIDSAAKYDADVAIIRTSNLTLRGVGDGRAKLDCKGKDAGGKGIWVQYGQNLTVENIEFIGARCADKNGAGIRAQGKGLSVRNCRFYDCENGILGGVGDVTIENSQFDHCGHSAQPASHCLYIGKECTKLLFRFNYSTFAHQGHLLKTRAQESWILYNRITDEEGGGSAVADFPNGGVVVLIGNLLQKGKKGNNNRVIAYGMEGVTHPRNELYVVSNTMVWDHRRPFEFVHVEKTPENFTPIIRNNLCIGPIPLTNAAKSDASGNVLLKTMEEAALIDPKTCDYRPTPKSPAIAKAQDPGKLGDCPLTPEFQYLHPASKEKRPPAEKPDAGAYQHAPAK